MELYENERLDYVNDDLSLIQNTEGLTFGTDALLLAGYIGGGYSVGCELGGGTGIISMLLSTRKKVGRIYAVEVQEDFASLMRRNVEYNSLANIECIHADVREYRAPEECDLVYTNPPYMKTTSGYSNASSKKNIARHEVMGGIEDFVLVARRLLKYGGDMAVVYRTDRLIDLLVAMREGGIEPKRMTYVLADHNSAPSMVLVVGRRGGRPSLITTEPLYIYSDKEHKTYSEDMEYILKTGSFPEKFYTK